MYRYEDEEPSAPELKQTVSVDGIDRLVTIHLVRLPFVFEEDIEYTKKMLSESKDLTILETKVKIQCALSDASRTQIAQLADALSK